MEKEKRETDIKPKIPEAILRETALQFNDLDLQAEESLIKNKDIITLKQKLQERAQLIVNLPSLIQESIDHGHSFPESEMEEIKEWSLIAEITLNNFYKSKQTFALSALLETQGSEIGDPNCLEELIDRLYPSK